MVWGWFFNYLFESLHEIRKLSDEVCWIFIIICLFIKLYLNILIHVKEVLFNVMIDRSDKFGRN